MEVLNNFGYSRDTTMGHVLMIEMAARSSKPEPRVTLRVPSNALTCRMTHDHNYDRVMSLLSCWLWTHLALRSHARWYSRCTTSLRPCPTCGIALHAVNSRLRTTHDFTSLVFPLMCGAVSYAFRLFPCFRDASALPRPTPSA